MSPDVIVIAIALLAVAGALVAVAVAIMRRNPKTAELEKFKKPKGSAGDIEIVTSGGEDYDDEESEHSHEELGTYVPPAPARVLKVTDLPCGEVEVMVEWDPNHMPSSFRGKTVEEATENAFNAVRRKRAAQGDW